MSWFVFTEDELMEMQDFGHGEMVEEFREEGEWTEHDTLLVDVEGPKTTLLVGCYSKYPRRMARDPPMETRPSNTKLADL